MEACRSRVDVSLVPLHVDTRGAVETVLALLQRMEDAVRTRAALSADWQSRADGSRACAQDLSRPMLTVDGNTFYEEDIVSQFRGYRCNCVFYAEQPDDETTPAFSCAPRSARHCCR